MGTKRYHVSGFVQNFQVSYGKWNVHKIEEYIINLIKKAFSTWEQHADINFVRNNSYPDILVSFGTHRHLNYNPFSQCSESFDGINGILAHAFLPNRQQSPIEINFYSDEN